MNTDRAGQRRRRQRRPRKGWPLLTVSWSVAMSRLTPLALGCLLLVWSALSPKAGTNPEVALKPAPLNQPRKARSFKWCQGAGCAGVIP